MSEQDSKSSFYLHFSLAPDARHSLFSRKLYRMLRRHYGLDRPTSRQIALLVAINESRDFLFCVEDSQSSDDSSLVSAPGYFISNLLDFIVAPRQIMTRLIDRANEVLDTVE